MIHSMDNRSSSTASSPSSGSGSPPSWVTATTFSPSSRFQALEIDGYANGNDADERMNGSNGYVYIEQKQTRQHNGRQQPHSNIWPNSPSSSITATASYQSTPTHHQHYSEGDASIIDMSQYEQ